MLNPLLIASRLLLWTITYPSNTTRTMPRYDPIVLDDDLNVHDLTGNVLESFQLLKLLALKVNENFNEFASLIAFFGLLVSYVNLFIFWHGASFFYFIAYAIQLALHHFALETISSDIVSS